MDLKEAIQVRHSVRTYLDKPIEGDVLKELQDMIAACNRDGELHIQLVQNEPKAFQGRLAKYGKFSGVSNYLVMAGHKSASLDERIGYYGEKIVLLAQSLGLNTCWVGLSYSKIPGTYVLDTGEKIVCYIAIGYGATQGADHKRKTIEQVSNVTDDTPEWFVHGVEAALLAPTAINQQKFFFEYLPSVNGKKAEVAAKRQFSMVGYTKIDLGIAKYNFEVGAGQSNFDWR